MKLRFLRATMITALMPACNLVAQPETARDWQSVPTANGGPLIPEQAAYDVQQYALELNIDPTAQAISGTVTVSADILEPISTFVLDIDQVFTVTSVTKVGDVSLGYEHRDGRLRINLGKTALAGEDLKLAVAYNGKPRVAPAPPWEGGFTWAKTAQGKDWIGVSCQFDGADLWWPVKGHPSDEPDMGVDLRFTTHDSLTVISNGRLMGRTENSDGTATTHWRVTTPINTYNITFNAAPFVPVRQDYVSVSGRKLPVTFWALPQDQDQAHEQMPELVDHLHFLEKMFGPYPFQADKYSLVEAPYIAMEHQTAITYGKLAMDTTRMGFLYIALHELVHEWWGNLVSADDWRDFWLHEGFTGYTEALYAEHLYGEKGYHEYIARFIRPGVKPDAAVASIEATNIRAITQDYDPFLKGAMVLHSLRFLLGDEVFFTLLRRQAYPNDTLEGLLTCEQCRNATSNDFMALTNELSGRDLRWFFDVYLYGQKLPELIVKDRGDQLDIRWDTPEGLLFPMPVDIERNGKRERIAMPEGRATISKSQDEKILVDPNFRVLRKKAPSPDQFGTLGEDDYVGLQSTRNE